MTERIQLKRTKGWRLREAAADAVKVDRTTKWGNPFKVGQPFQPGPLVLSRFPVHDQAHAVALFRQALLDPEGGPGDMTVRRTIGDIRASLHLLRGKPLACWCKPGTPCHADVLLDLANRVTCNSG